jgi:hypothetical protein
MTQALYAYMNNKVFLKKELLDLHATCVWEASAVLLGLSFQDGN